MVQSMTDGVCFSRESSRMSVFHSAAGGWNKEKEMSPGPCTVAIKVNYYCLTSYYCFFFSEGASEANFES